MTRRIAAFSLPVLALLTIAARKPNDPKHENHFKLENPPKSDVLSAQLTNAQAQSQFVAVDAKVTNTTTDKLLVFKKGEANFILPQGSFQTKAGGLLGGPIFFQPGDTKGVGFKVDGDTGFHVESFTLEPRGFYMANNAGGPLAAPEYQLPPSMNNFDAGPFACNLVDHVQKTSDTQATFQCVYNGKGVGFVDARRIGARSQSGTEYANVAKNSKRDMVLPGEKTKFPVWIRIPAADGDMQFVPFTVMFRDAFSESALDPVDLGPLNFVLDAEKTAAENK